MQGAVTGPGNWLGAGCPKRYEDDSGLGALGDQEEDGSCAEMHVREWEYLWSGPGYGLRAARVSMQCCPALGSLSLQLESKVWAADLVWAVVSTEVTLGGAGAVRSPGREVAWTEGRRMWVFTLQGGRGVPGCVWSRSAGTSWPFSGNRSFRCRTHHGAQHCLEGKLLKAIIFPQTGDAITKICIPLTIRVFCSFPFHSPQGPATHFWCSPHLKIQCRTP